MSKIKIVLAVMVIVIFGLIGYVLVKGKADADVILPVNSSIKPVSYQLKLTFSLPELKTLSQNNWTVYNNKLYVVGEEEKSSISSRAVKYDLATGQSSNLPLWKGAGDSNTKVALLTTYVDTHSGDASVYLFTNNRLGVTNNYEVKVFKLNDANTEFSLYENAENILSGINYPVVISDNFKSNDNNSRVAVAVPVVQGGFVTKFSMKEFDFTTAKWSSIGEYPFFRKPYDSNSLNAGVVVPLTFNNLEMVRYKDGQNDNFYTFGGDYERSGVATTVTVSNKDAIYFLPATLYPHNQSEHALARVGADVYLFGSAQPIHLSPDNKIDITGSSNAKYSEKYTLSPEINISGKGIYPSIRITDTPNQEVAQSAKYIQGRIWLITDSPTGSKLYLVQP